jgi:hypothetical protein
MVVFSIRLHILINHHENMEELYSFTKLEPFIYNFQENFKTYKVDCHLYYKLSIQNNISKELLIYSHHHLLQF